MENNEHKIDVRDAGEPWGWGMCLEVNLGVCSQAPEISVQGGRQIRGRYSKKKTQGRLC